ncbi:MAG: hypothetical protein SXV54_20985 [Chloroflexota bacterium]|nr:hypothetical protein [Chloroflexota bacterium]
MAARSMLSRLREVLGGDGAARQRAAEESHWEQILRSGEQTVVDHLAPSVLVEEPDCFQVGDVWGRAYFVADLPPGMVLNVETVLRFAGDTWWSWFIYPEPETEIHPALKHRRTTLYGENILDARRGALGSFSRQAELSAVEEGLVELELRQRTLYQLGWYFAVYAESKERLHKVCQRLEDFLKSQGVVFHIAYLQQPHGMYSLLPTGTDRLRTWRNMTADALGAMFPFTRKVYYDPQGYHYGIHKYNGTWVVLNPFALEMDNASELVLGRPGRGKSAYFKQQIDLLVTLAHRVFVVDIEGEYRALCDDMGGVYLEFSRTAGNRLNILDLNPLANDPFGAGMSTLMGFLTVALSRPLAPVERNVIVPRYYDEVMRQAGILRDDPATWDRPAPRLSDLRMVLERAEETAARELAQLLYIYTEGMYGDVFDQSSNVDLAQAPFIVFGLRDVAREIAGLYLWLITNLVWTAVSAAAAAQPIHLFVDEGWHLLQYAGTAAELGAMARRFRKHYAAIHLATQFGQDLARSPDAEVIRDAVGIVTLFGQHPRAAEDLGLLFHLEPHEVAELVQLAKGEALLLWNHDVHVPLYVPLPPDRADLYKTDPEQQRRAALARGVTPVVVE